MKITEEQIEEILKCREDPVYFLGNFLFLRHTTKGKIPWDKPYTYQVKVLRSLQNGENVLINKSRRVGASWIVCAFSLWRTMFYPDQSILLLSQKEFSAKSLLARIKFMYDNLPPWMRTKRGTNSKTELSFLFQYGDQSAESTIVSLTTTNRSGAGEDAGLVMVDEAAHIENADDVWAAIGPTAAFGGQRAIVSTPNSIGDFFDRLVSQCQMGLDIGFTYIEAHWKRDCALSDEWYKKATVGLSTQRRLREFELTPLGSGFPFFDLMKVKACYKPPSEHPEILEAMKKTKLNFSGVDTSEGHSRTGGEDPDYHSICVMNEWGVQIYAWHDNKMTLGDFAGQTVDIGDKRVEIEGIPAKIHREFPGIMVIERWGTGDVTLSRHKPPNDGRSMVVPFRTTNTSKMRVLNALRLAINEEEIVITDPFTYHCLLTFEDQSSGVTEKAGAAKGTFDDPVMTLAFCVHQWKRHGGYKFDFTGMTTTDGRRMVSISPGYDVNISEIDKVLAVGQQAIGPLTDASIEDFVPGSFRRGIDDLELIRSGAARMRPPGM